MFSKATFKAAKEAKKDGYEYMKETVSESPPGFRILKIDDLLSGAYYAPIIYSNTFGRTIERSEMETKYK